MENSILETMKATFLFVNYSVIHVGKSVLSFSSSFVTRRPLLATSLTSNIFYNVLISDCLQHLIVLSQLVQLLINILYIWKSFLYHCPLTRRIITHSVIKQSAKTWPCALSAKNYGISRRLNVVDIMIVTFFI